MGMRGCPDQTFVGPVSRGMDCGFYFSVIDGKSLKESSGNKNGIICFLFQRYHFGFRVGQSQEVREEQIQGRKMFSYPPQVHWLEPCKLNWQKTDEQEKNEEKFIVCIVHTLSMRVILSD